MAGAYNLVLDEHRRRLARLMGRGGVDRLKAVYDTAQARVAAQVAKVAGPMGDSFTAHTQRLVLGQLRQGQAQIAEHMAGELGDLSEEAQTESLHGLSADINRLDAHYKGVQTVVPIEEASKFLGVVDKRRTSLMQMHQTSMATYGASLVGTMEESLGMVLATGGTTFNAIETIEKTAEMEWWRAERIARTEIAWAFNSTTADGLMETAGYLPDLRMRWTEHVTEDGQPMDLRVGEDSIVMHGQLAHPGGVFTMPEDERVSETMWGETWYFPPNRPNDRAVLAPWRPGWDTPGWEFRAGERVELE